MVRDPMRGKAPLDSRPEAEEQNIIRCVEGAKCPFCEAVTSRVDDVEWFFSYKSCPHCGRNYLVRKRASSDAYESKKSEIPWRKDND